MILNQNMKYIKNFLLILILNNIIVFGMLLLIFLGWSFIKLEWIDNFITWKGIRLFEISIFFFSLIIVPSTKITWNDKSKF